MSKGGFESDYCRENLVPEDGLKDAVIGIRLYTSTPVTPNGIQQLEAWSKDVGDLKTYLEAVFGDGAPKVAIITNGDTEQERVLGGVGAIIVSASPVAATRRSHLAKLIVADSATSGKLDSPTMLNVLSDPKQEWLETSGYPSHCFFVSGDYAKRQYELITQLLGMERVRMTFEQVSPGSLCLIGSMLDGVHDPQTAQGLVEGRVSLDITNVNSVFPNNAMSLVDIGTHFSEIVANGLAGTINLDGEQVPVGGNEDFLYGLEQMIYHGRKAILLIHPYLSKERTGEVRSVEKKYLRRQAIYKLYADRVLEQAKARGRLPDDATFEDIIDSSLFFAQINDVGKPEIVLTARQKERGIALPI